MTANIPKYRRQKHKDRADAAFVELNGRRHYLGRYGSPESKEKYHRLLAEWESLGQQPPVADGQITVVELIIRFWRHVNGGGKVRRGSEATERRGGGCR